MKSGGLLWLHVYLFGVAMGCFGDLPDHGLFDVHFFGNILKSWITFSGGMDLFLGLDWIGSRGGNDIRLH